MIFIKFVKSEESDADPTQKTLQIPSFNTLTQDCVAKKELQNEKT